VGRKGEKAVKLGWKRRISRWLFALSGQSDRLHCFQIYSWIDNFVTEHSDIVSKIHIGNSFENRSIFVLKVKVHCAN
jgi:hypothetical protein